MERQLCTATVLWTLAGIAFGQVVPSPEKLTLADYRVRVEAANQSLAARRLDEQISRLQARGERAVLEPALVGGVSRNRTERQNSVEQSLSQNAPIFTEDGESFSAGLEGRLPVGTKYWIGASVDNRSNNLTNAWVRTPFTDEYLGFAGIRVSQPLLKDAGMGAILARIRLADAEARVKHQELRKQTMALVSRAELAYWNLALAQHLLELRQASVRIAEQVLNDNRERVRAGKMAENEVLEAEVGLARRQTQASDAAQTVVAMRNLVRSFISATPDDAAVANIEAADEPALAPLDTDYVLAMRRALRRHPDYIALQEVVRQEGVRVAYSRSQRWPQVDLVASYGLNGIGASASDAFDQIGRNDYETWSVGIEVRLPLGGGVREQTELAAAKARQRQALLELHTAEVEIGNALDTALRRVNATREQAAHLQRMVEFNSKLLESELSRLDAGKSDSRRVLQIEQDLVEARIAAYQALVEHRRAWLDWEVAQGILLDQRQMEPREVR